MKALAPALLLVLAAAPLAAQDDLQLFFGLLHGHTRFSDGRGDPADAYQTARAAGLDFFAVTEHNHSQAGGDDGVFLTPQLYEQLKQAAAEATEDGAFVALYGQEVSSISKGNHVNVFHSDTLVDVANGDFRDLYDRYLPEHPEVPFIQFNHPDASRDQNPNTRASERHNDYGIDDYNQSFPELVAAADRAVALIELIIGPAFNQATGKQHHDGTHESDYLFYLNQGFRLGPSVGQDNHHPNWGTSTHARLGTWAAALSRDGLFEALRSRRTYASEDENLRVSFKLGETWMGDAARVEEGEEAAFVLSIADPDEPDATYTVSLLYDESVGGLDARVVESAAFTGDVDALELRHSPDPGGYYFVRIRQRSNAEEDADDAWTAPIWIAAPEDEDPGEEHSETGPITWQEATDFVGREKTVVGRIVDTFDAGSVFFLNFDPDFRETLTLVVFAGDLDDFGGADELAARLEGKVVTVRGTITLFRGRPQLILNRPDQILAVED